MAGARGKLTKELIKRACALKKKGYTNIQICEALEISQETFYRWQRGEDLTPLGCELCEGLKKAEAAKQAAILARIEKAGNDSWQALAWYAERMWPERFGRVDRLQATVEQTTQAEVKTVVCFDYGDGENG